jgi:phage-related minor tail protein
VEVVNSADIKSEAIGASGVPIPTTSITGDATTNKLSTDLRASMAANLNSQIQNDNLNAKALITNSLSTVGTNLMSGAINSFFGFANGGVAKGGFRAFANGGTVKQPTLGLVGEGKYNEAVVPLPDGKSIPVIGAGGNSGDNNVTVNVTVDSNGNAKSDTQSGMDGDQAKQLGYMVSQAVQQELMQQQRPGGLLSSY